MKLSELYWHRTTPLHFILWPLSVLYGFFLTFKKYAIGWIFCLQLSHRCLLLLLIVSAQMMAAKHL